MYFDEAHTLTASDAKSEEGKSHYEILLSTLEDIRLHTNNILTLFLSTVSHMPRLAPRRAVVNSSRVSQPRYELASPITEVPFDCGPKIPIKPNEYDAEEVAKIEFMANFGRPLYVWYRSWLRH